MNLCVKCLTWKDCEIVQAIIVFIEVYMMYDFFFSKRSLQNGFGDNAMNMNLSLFFICSFFDSF